MTPPGIELGSSGIQAGSSAGIGNDTAPPSCPVDPDEGVRNPIWFRFANNPGLPDLSELESPASSPAGERSSERVTLPADVQLWIELEVFLERIGQDQGDDHERDSRPLLPWLVPR